jgi:hypothetical protein
MFSSSFTPSTSDRVIFPGRTVRITSGAAGGVLRARDGELWVTFERAGDRSHRGGQDYFLTRGQALYLVDGDVAIAGPADCRYGMASLDWTPIHAECPALADQLLRALAGQLGAAWRSLARRWGTRALQLA